MGATIVYVARVPTRRRIMTVSIAVGTRFPAYATSMGRVLLAGLEPAQLDATLAGIELQPFTDTTVHDIDELRPPSPWCASVDSPSSTRNSNTACARRRRRSATTPAR